MTARSSEKVNRRRFMKLAAVGTVAPMGLGKPKMDDKAVAAAAGQRGYRDTDHVKTYYQSTRL